jgi:hypothetical protein
VCLEEIFADNDLRPFLLETALADNHVLNSPVVSCMFYLWALFHFHSIPVYIFALEPEMKIWQQCLATFFDPSCGFYSTRTQGQRSFSRCSIVHGKKVNFVASSPQANYTDLATAACRRSYCQLFRIEGVAWSAQRIPRPLIRFSWPEPLLFHSSSSSVILARLSGPAEWTPFQTHYFSENLVAPGVKPGTSGSVARNSDH